MSYVEIYRLTNKGQQDLYASCTLGENGKVTIHGNDSFRNRLEKQGIIDRGTKSSVKIFPSDGLRFLELLKNYFNNGYLQATDIISI